MSRFLSIRQVADMLSIPHSTVRKLIRDAQLAPVVRITPHRVMVEEDVVERFVSTRREVGGYGRKQNVSRMVSRSKVRE